jgi:hypothetical protein
LSIKSDLRSKEEFREKFTKWFSADAGENKDTKTQKTNIPVKPIFFKIVMVILPGKRLRRAMSPDSHSRESTRECFTKFRQAVDTFTFSVN